MAISMEKMLLLLKAFKKLHFSILATAVNCLKFKMLIFLAEFNM